MSGKKLLLPACAAALALCTGLPWGPGPAAEGTAGPGARSTGNLVAAPYFMPLDNDPQPIDDVLANSGTKDFILAFVLSSGGCTPAWNGQAGQPVSGDTAVGDKIGAIRAAGGDVSVSFGGYNGLELGADCGDSASLANAYQAVIDKYKLKYVDFDIEGDDLGDVAGETKRFEAIKTLKQRNSGLHVSLTLPVTSAGLSDLGKAEIQRAKDIGAEIDLFKVMLFDYGGPAADQANDVIRIAELVHGQLRTLHPEFDDAAAYAKTGAIFMNGHTDQPSELFTADTFRTLVGYVQQHKLGRVSFWSLNRDRACSGSGGGWADGKCSSVDQQPYDFTKIISQYQG